MRYFFFILFYDLRGQGSCRFVVKVLTFQCDWNVINVKRRLRCYYISFNIDIEIFLYK